MVSKVIECLSMSLETLLSFACLELFGLFQILPGRSALFQFVMVVLIRFPVVLFLQIATSQNV